MRWRDSPAFIEGRWHPERGETMQLLGLERVTRLGDANQVLKGLRLLRLLDQRGNKRGNTFRKKEDVITDTRRLLSEDAASFIVRSVESIGEVLGIPRDTWFRYLREWPELKEIVDARPRGMGSRI